MSRALNARLLNYRQNLRPRFVRRSRGGELYDPEGPDWRCAGMEMEERHLPEDYERQPRLKPGRYNKNMDYVEDINVLRPIGGSPLGGVLIGGGPAGFHKYKDKWIRTGVLPIEYYVPKAQLRAQGLLPPYKRPSKKKKSAPRKERPTLRPRVASGRCSSWLAFVKDYRYRNPGISYKQALKDAGPYYREECGLLHPPRRKSSGKSNAQLKREYKAEKALYESQYGILHPSQREPHMNMDVELPGGAHGRRRQARRRYPSIYF
jgi:hypothetical protein